ncbi:MAG: hypothetical protein AAGC93_09960 [Cyanobacteria bacterium P01_F01_bin.53]
MLPRLRIVTFTRLRPVLKAVERAAPLPTSLPASLTVLFTTLSLLFTGSATPSMAEQPPNPIELQTLNRQIEAINTSPTADLQDLEIFVESLDAQTQEIQAVDDTLEGLTPGHAERLDRYETHLATCSPHVSEDLFFPESLEVIRGWVGERCQVDRRVMISGQPQGTSCLYTRQDIARITEITHALPEDLAQQCQHIQ